MNLKKCILNNRIMLGFVFCNMVFFACGIDNGSDYKKWPDNRFNSEAWKSSKKENRYFFCKDLIDNKILYGFSTQKISKLLGQPDYQSPDGEYVTYIVKYAEPEEYNFNSVYLLNIDFDKNRNVEKYFIRAD